MRSCGEAESFPNQNAWRGRGESRMDANSLKSGTRPRQGRRRSRVTSFLLALLCGYVLLVLCGCAWQRKLLYHPARYSLAEETALARERGFSLWTNSAGEMMGWKYVRSDDATWNVLILHGNGGAAIGRGYLAQSISQATPADVYVLEYPGYGARGGRPSLKSWLRSAEAALAALPQGRSTYLVSESLGTGPAAHLARRHPEQVSGMVMFVPYDSLPALAQNRMPWLLPYFFLRDRYRPAAWLRDYRQPIQFVIAGADQTIPPKFGERLYENYAGPKQLQVISGAAHNEATEHPPEWWRDTFDFLMHPSDR